MSPSLHLSASKQSGKAVQKPLLALSAQQVNSPPRAPPRHPASVTSPSLGCCGCFTFRFEKCKADSRVRFAQHFCCCSPSHVIIIPLIPRHFPLSGIITCTAAATRASLHSPLPFARLVPHTLPYFSMPHLSSHLPPRRHPLPLPCAPHPAAHPPHP